jgi:hypothetical protein
MSPNRLWTRCTQGCRSSTSQRGPAPLLRGTGDASVSVGGLPGSCERVPSRASDLHRRRDDSVLGTRSPQQYRPGGSRVIRAAHGACGTPRLAARGTRHGADAIGPSGTSGQRGHDCRGIPASFARTCPQCLQTMMTAWSLLTAVRLQTVLHWSQNRLTARFRRTDWMLVMVPIWTPIQRAGDRRAMPTTRILRLYPSPRRSSTDRSLDGAAAVKAAALAEPGICRGPTRRAAGGAVPAGPPAKARPGIAPAGSPAQITLVVRPV